MGEAVSRLIAFGAMVYAARVLGPEGYGVVGVAAAVTLYLNRIADAGFELGLGVREIAADPAFLGRTAPSVLAFRTLLATLLALGVGAAALWLLDYPDGPVVAVQALTLLAVGIGPRWIHLGYHRTALAAIAASAGQAVMALLVLALVRGPADVTTVPAAQVAGDLAVSAILVAALVRLEGRLPLRLDWELLKPLLPRAWHLVASALLGIVIYSAGLLLLRGVHGSGAAGQYAAAYTLVTFFLNVGAMYNLSLLPSLTRLAADRPRQLELYHTALAHVFAIGFPAAVGGALLAGAGVQLMYGDSYRAAAVPFALLVWSIPLNLLRDVPLMALMSAGQERVVFRVTITSALLAVALGLVLVPRFGLSGAGAATLLAEVSRMLLALAFARAQGFPLPAPGRFGRAAVAASLMGLGLGLVGPASVLVGIPLGGALYLAALAALGGLRYVRGPGGGLELTV